MASIPSGSAAVVLRKVLGVLTSRGVITWGLPMTVLMPILHVATGAMELPTSPLDWAGRFGLAFLGYGVLGGTVYELAMVSVGAWQRREDG